jgi:hypothetical protein
LDKAFYIVRLKKQFILNFKIIGAILVLFDFAFKFGYVPILRILEVLCNFCKKQTFLSEKITHQPQDKF